MRREQFREHNSLPRCVVLKQMSLQSFVASRLSNQEQVQGSLIADQEKVNIQDSNDQYNEAAKTKLFEMLAIYQQFCFLVVNYTVFSQ